MISQERIMNAVSQTVSALAIAFLDQTLQNGGTIEIPSLGISIQPEEKSTMPELRVLAFKKGYAVGEWDDKIVMYAVYVSGESYEVSVADHMIGLRECKRIMNSLEDRKLCQT